MEGIVIFCGAYHQVKNALYVITQNHPKRPITIIIPTVVRDFFKLFNAFNERLFHNTLNLMQIELFQPKRAQARGLKRIFYILPDIIRERRHWKETFNKYLSEIEGCEVFFFDRGFNQFSLVKNLTKRNRIVYISCYPTGTDPVQYTPRNIVDLVKLIIMKLIYGPYMSIAGYPHSEGFPNVSDRFMEKEVDSVIEGEERDEMMKDFHLSQFNIFDTGNYRVIYFDSGLLGTPCLKDDNIHRRELAEVFAILIKYFPENEIALKYHPDRPEEKKKFIQIGNILPDFIPAELLYNDNIKMYLGICSSSLANVEKGLAVSIMDLISFRNDKMRNGMKEILLKMSRSEILFPKSLDDLEQILTSEK